MNTPSTRTIYLAGGIHGLRDSQCKAWRDHATTVLCRAGFAVLDPLRRDYRGREDSFVRDLVRFDLFDVSRATHVLVNVCRPSWGTAMELAYSRMLPGRRIVVAFGASPPRSPWLTYHCDAFADDLTGALAALGAVQ